MVGQIVGRDSFPTKKHVMLIAGKESRPTQLLLNLLIIKMAGSEKSSTVVLLKFKCQLSCYYFARIVVVKLLGQVFHS
jgi:hypothetical protein